MVNWKMVKQVGRNKMVKCPNQKGRGSMRMEKMAQPPSAKMVKLVKMENG